MRGGRWGRKLARLRKLRAFWGICGLRLRAAQGLCAANTMRNSYPDCCATRKRCQRGRQRVESGCSAVAVGRHVCCAKAAPTLISALSRAGLHLCPVSSFRSPVHLGWTLRVRPLAARQSLARIALQQLTHDPSPMSRSLVAGASRRTGGSVEDLAGGRRGSGG